LASWAATAAPLHKARLVHQLFEEQAAAAPDAPAVAAADGELSYGELERRASALAARLSTLGVGPEVRVGLCVSRAARAVVGMLGVLKAGGAYVPLDPA